MTYTTHKIIILPLLTTLILTGLFFVLSPKASAETLDQDQRLSLFVHLTGLQVALDDLEGRGRVLAAQITEEARIAELFAEGARLQNVLDQMLVVRDTPALTDDLSLDAARGGNAVTPVLTRNLYIGSRGTEVSALQSFLTNTGDYTYGEATGYYGPITEAAVQRYQTRNNIVTSGTPATTGYGVVGPRTRAFLTSLPDTLTAGDNAARRILPSVSFLR